MIDGYNEKMCLLGYVPRGENKINGRRYFTKGIDERTHHIHIYEKDHENIKLHLDFKEYLINHPTEAMEYGELKIKLAEQYPENTYKYQEGKQKLLNKLIKKAKNWRSN